MKINAYSMIGSHGTDWPSSVLELFADRKIEQGVFWFPEGSGEEQQFRGMLVSLGIRFERRGFIAATARDLERYPYYYLRVQADKDQLMDVFMDYSAACKGGGQIATCFTGVRQARRIALDPLRSKKHDIMYEPGSLKPVIIIVSTRAKELLETMKVTGCEFLPCDRLGDGHQGEGLRYDANHPHELSEIGYYQLRIVCSTAKPPRVGSLTQTYARCSVCGAVHGFASSSDEYFEKKDLLPVDFQSFTSCLADNVGEFPIAPEQVIVSSRILQAYAKEDIKGLRWYLKIPPIQFRAVEIREDPNTETGHSTKEAK